MTAALAVEPKYLKIEEAAVVLNIPKGTLTKMVTKRTIQHTRMGRHVRFSEDDIAAYARSCVVPVEKPALVINSSRGRRRVSS